MKNDFQKHQEDITTSEIQSEIQEDITTSETQEGKNTSKKTEKAEKAVPSFSQLNLGDAIVSAVSDAGFKVPTPIQAGVIPKMLEGHNIIGTAQTGTGKTASFLLPLIQKLSKGTGKARMPRGLILSPTRELAMQTAEQFAMFTKNIRLTHALVMGGVSTRQQEKLLSKNIDVVICTPGRLLDLFQRGSLLLRGVDTIVVDEADRMLDMGFIPDLEKIFSLIPGEVQTLVFSATMPKVIRSLVSKFVSNPAEIRVDQLSSSAKTVDHVVVRALDSQKLETVKRLIDIEQPTAALIFCNRKRDVDNVTKSLRNISVGRIHGDLSQNTRSRTLKQFREGKLQILVASDVAARGIDVDGITHVINYDKPLSEEDYVHRTGRTGRAGRKGKAITLINSNFDRFIKMVKSKISGRSIEIIDWRKENDLEDSENPDNVLRRPRKGSSGRGSDRGSDRGFAGRGRDSERGSSRGFRGRPSSSSRSSGRGRDSERGSERGSDRGFAGRGRDSERGSDRGFAGRGRDSERGSERGSDRRFAGRGRDSERGSERGFAGRGRDSERGSERGSDRGFAGRGRDSERGSDRGFAGRGRDSERGSDRGFAGRGRDSERGSDRGFAGRGRDSERGSDRGFAGRGRDSERGSDRGFAGRGRDSERGSERGSDRGFAGRGRDSERGSDRRFAGRGRDSERGSERGSDRGFAGRGRDSERGSDGRPARSSERGSYARTAKRSDSRSMSSKKKLSENSNDKITGNSKTFKEKQLPSFLNS